MPDVDDESSKLQRLVDDAKMKIMDEDLDNPLRLIDGIYELWRHWADFHLYITSPIIPEITPPITHEPEFISGTNDKEFVYNIRDHGYKLSTSKGEEMYSAGMSMCKLYYTIEKMIYLLIERLKSGGIDEKTEVQIAFGGHEMAQRKAFESVINLKYNVVVNNFDPGEWGEYYLTTVKKLADKGFGYPSGTPRKNFKQGSPSSSVIKKN